MNILQTPPELNGRVEALGRHTLALEGRYDMFAPATGTHQAGAVAFGQALLKTHAATSFFPAGHLRLIQSTSWNGGRFSG